MMPDMPALGAAALYCSLNIAILVWITVAIGLIRRRERILIGAGGNDRLAKAMRGHANAIEIMPMTLVALILAALLGAPVLLVHALGLTLTIGRFLHGYHFTRTNAPIWQRMAGFALSMLAMIGSAISAFYLGLVAMA
ncbi:MAPEG family protein [Fulvimarina sp. 2208YS6-2-32]|uniref:MAPEG family protein n=1 Tax=Fulvimarina uroteuthidis TaxID=3098149 RepID=A0ABU5I6P0_9HYPH|nr:MAPEG family protein [Fulvimarina sp. 2208YS6-2-32]MDY8110423.1 MAPEG family protein [Fulvimarina sp. 2208YS6-2-32]